MAQAEQGKGLKSSGIKLTTIYIYNTHIAELTNECGLSQGAATKFVRFLCVENFFSLRDSVFMLA